MFYTYLHLRESDGKPFYIGKGQGDRADTRRNRSEHWKRVVAKHGLKVEILARWSVEQEAFEHEKFLISCFRDMGHNLVNATDGGEGSFGRITSEETKKKISVSRLGKPITKETKEKISLILKDRFFSKEHREKLSEANKKRKGKPISESLRKKLKKAHKDFFWVNNNLEEKLVKKNCPLPEGFVLGRLKKAKNGA